MLPGDELPNRVVLASLVELTDSRPAWNRSKPHGVGAKAREGVDAACTSRLQARSPSPRCLIPLSRDSGRCLLPHHASILVCSPFDMNNSDGSASTGDTSLASCKVTCARPNYPDPGLSPYQPCTEKSRPHSIRLTSSESKYQHLALRLVQPYPPAL